MLDDPAPPRRCSAASRIRARLAYAQIASRTEHLVLSTTLADVTWPSARIVRSIEEIRSVQARRPRHGLRRRRADADHEPARRGPARRAPSDRPPDPHRGRSGHHRSPRQPDNGWSSLRPNRAAGERVTLTYRLPRADERLAVRPERLQRVRDPGVPRERRRRGRRARRTCLSSCSRRPTHASGRPRTTPLAYHRRGDRYVVIASNGGATRHPNWFRNLEQDPNSDSRGRRRDPLRHGTNPRRRGARRRLRRRSSRRRRQRAHSRRRPAERFR